MAYRREMPVFGFTSVPSGDVCRNVQNEDQQDVMRKLMRMYNAGWQMYSIADEMNAKGHRTVKGREWSKYSVNEYAQKWLGLFDYPAEYVTWRRYKNFQTKRRARLDAREERRLA